MGTDHVSIRVDDVDEVHGTLLDWGVEFLLDPVTEDEWGLRTSAVRDPGGNVFYFVAPA